jgi:hypothetical protein
VLGKGRRDLGEVLEPRRAFRQMTLKPAQRRLLTLRRPALRVQIDKLKKIFKRQVRELAGCVLAEPRCPPLDGSAEAPSATSIPVSRSKRFLPEPDLGVKMAPEHATFMLVTYWCAHA